MPAYNFKLNPGQTLKVHVWFDAAKENEVKLVDHLKHDVFTAKNGPEYKTDYQYTNNSGTIVGFEVLAKHKKEEEAWIENNMKVFHDYTNFKIIGYDEAEGQRNDYNDALVTIKIK
jgi:hypothetical protein